MRKTILVMLALGLAVGAGFAQAEEFITQLEELLKD